MNPLVFVSNIGDSVDFYRDLLRREPIERDQYFVLFEDGFALHDGSELLLSIYPHRSRHTVSHWGRDNLALYFESDDIEGDHRRLADRYPLIHPLRLEPWGGRIFRLHDPDQHVVEIGERTAPAHPPMDSLGHRFPALEADSGDEGDDPAVTSV